MENTKLKKIVEKVSELGKLQQVERRITRKGGDRYESTAEHSWQVAMMAWFLLPHYEEKLNMEKVLKLALIHDIVEIYAGDTFAFDYEHKKTKHQREDAAAGKLFKKSDEMHKLWRDYALRKSPEARYIAGIDKLVPMIRHQEIKKLKPTWYGVLKESEVRAYKIPQLKHSRVFMEMFEYLNKRIKDLGFFAEEQK